VKIATFNINNVNKRLANLIAWLRAARPDVVCLQELKAADREFPQAAIEKEGYGAVCRAAARMCARPGKSAKFLPARSKTRAGATGASPWRSAGPAS